MATDQNLEILITANADGVKTGMTDAQQSVRNAGAEMAQSLKTVETETKGAVGSIIDSFKRMAAGAAETQKETTTHFGAMGGAFSKLTGPLMAVTGLLAGGAMFREAVSATMEMTGEANKLARQLGITAGAASILRVAMGDVYLSTEDAASAANSMARQVRTNEAAMNAMGLRTREANGELRSTTDMMRDAGAIVGTYREGMDQTNATVMLFGRGVHDAGIALKFAKLDMEAAEEKARSLGLVLTKQGAADAAKYKEAMNDVGDVLEGVKKAVGDALIPVLAKLGEWFSTIGPAAVTIIRGAIGGVTAVFWGLKNAVVILWETLTAMIYSVTEPIVSLGNALVKLADGDMTGATNIMMGMPDRIAGRWSSAMKGMVESSEDTSKHLAALFADGPDAAKPKTGTKTAPTKGDKPDKAGKPQDDALMKQFEAELAETKVLFQEKQRAEDSFREYSKQQELEYWQSKLALVERGSKDESQIKLKVATLKLALDKSTFDAEIAGIKAGGEEYKRNADVQLQIAQQVADKMRKAHGEESKEYIEAQRAVVAAARSAAQQKLEIEGQSAQVHKTRQLDEIAAEEEMSQLRQTLGIQTMARSLELEREFAARKMEIQRQTLRAELAMIDPQKDPLAVAKLNAQLEQLETKHQATLRQIGAKGNAESLKEISTVMNGIQSAMESSFKGILTGTMSLSGAVKNAFHSIGETLASTASKMASDWIMNQIKMRIASKETALTQLNNNAMAAAGAAWNAVVGIPIVGPILAPAAAALSYAGVMAFGSIASAQGGYDIPAGVNPITQLHEQEMVLPKEQADAVRDMAGGGGSAPIIINASGGDLIHKNDLGKLLKQLNRKFEFV